MKNTIYLLLFFFGALTLTSNRTGRTTLTGQGVSGAPGESGQTCASFGCHSNGVFDPDVVISLLNEVGEEVTSYLPNQSYTVNLKINHTGNPAGYGFQIVSLLDSDETGINTFSNLTNQMQEVMVSNRQYVEQRNIIPNDLIRLAWTAPEAGSGPISFYGIGNAVNGNGNSSGDGAKSDTLKITEDLMSSNSTLQNQELNIYPNPAVEFINIYSTEKIKAVYIYNIQGKLVMRNSNTNTKINIQELSSGIYFLQALFESNQITHKRIIVSN
jgi:hypothetical protein